MSKIISIGTAVPEFSTKQSSILEFMQNAYQDESASRKLKILFNYSGISLRHSVISDFDSLLSTHDLFDENRNTPEIDKRLIIFKKEAALLAIKAIENSLEKLNTTIAQMGITHLITVSCTGLYAPGLDSDLIEKVNLPRDIFHTSFNFLGCNAAFPALKLADLIARTDENARILIVCVELCTLHFQPKNNNDNLLANTIFGDGAAAVILVPDSFPVKKGSTCLAVNGFYSLLLAAGKELMAWNITPINFEMILDAAIPEFIANEVGEIILSAKNKIKPGTENIDKWAIHPGGKKILDKIKNKMNLKDSDLMFSYKVLQEYGNMSSPTILFVLNEIMKADHAPGETVFSLGFGPGLSIETAMFTNA